MFGSKKKVEETQNTSSSSTSVRPVPPLGDNALNSLVRGTVTEGNLIAESDIRVDGIIKGNLKCSARVIIGPSGFVDGEINCQNAMIEGKFNGILRVIELLNVKETADITGDVTTGKLTIASGAVFNVTCKMKPEKGGNGTLDTNGKK
ncbi:MAG: polymer-forming cytoskeletal protein [Saprospiraceae bacterium]|nr:polymer-forming cytoskeletal protein [Saprospiraceae bacterium]